MKGAEVQNTSIIKRRFDELSAQLTTLAATKHNVGDDIFSGPYVDDEMFLNWKIKAAHLMSTACGEDSEHVRVFRDLQKGGGYRTNYDIMVKLKAVFEAAREDYEGGYLTTLRSMIHAEVFSSELDQARELLRGGYVSAAAVVAGVVLETTLRKLCDAAGIATGSLNKMNADLMKANVYNLLNNKQITASADIRNNAAHGNTDQFDKDDVTRMIDHVQAFAATHV